MYKTKNVNKYSNIRSLKGNNMIRKGLAISLILFASVLAESGAADDLKSSRIEKLESALANVINKAGIHIDGEFRSQFLYSTVTSGASNSVTSNVDSTKRSDEGVEYTSVDFDITARPHSAASGRVMFRLHQDWRNFFGALKSPISARWISMDGVVADMFRYNVGDFKQKYSELFMWSPDVEIDFEPELFAKYRRMAMKEDFLGNNERFLQGVNLNFDAEMDPVFDEIHLNLMGARLRSSGVRPEQGGNAVVGELEASRFDRYVFGFNADFTVIPDVGFGATFMNLWDDKNTYSGGSIASEDAVTLLRERTFVTGGRLNVGTAAFLDPKNLNVKIVDAEIALSLDDSAYLDVNSNLQHEVVLGMALKAGADLKVGLGGADGDVKLSADFVRNEHDYRNEMAQSPTFIGGSRIMNVENDFANGGLYTIYDALYRHVYKFSPSKDLAAGSNGFYKVPVRKVAYTSAVFTQGDMDTLNIYDNVFNFVMPNGPATANRMGADIDLDLDVLNKAILFKGDFSLFITPEDLFDATNLAFNQQTFMEYGGGLSFDLGKFGDWWKYPFVLSGSYKGSSKSNSSVSTTISGWQDVTSHFINGGLYFTFWKRASLLGGFQMHNSAINVKGQSNIDFNQMHWGAGLEWKVTENGTLSASFGQIFLEKTVGNDAGTFTSHTKDRYNQTDLYLTVNF